MLLVAFNVVVDPLQIVDALAEVVMLGGVETVARTVDLELLQY